MRRSVIAQKLELALRTSLEAPDLQLIDLDGERPAINEEHEPWITIKYGPAASTIVVAVNGVLMTGLWFLLPPHWKNALFAVKVVAPG